ncbi:MAG: response regulator [Thiocapsa sp.]|nr:ATP-binding protein [Thiocapsa sp.]MCG6895486.1 response regulator [Thiocapsa sp.]
MSTNDAPSARKSFLRRLLEVLLALSLGIGLLSPFIVFWASWEQSRLFGERTADEIAAVFATDARYALLVGSEHDARALLSNILKFPDVLSAALIDVQGRLIAEASAPEVAVARRTYAVEELVTAEERDAFSALEASTGTPRQLGRVRLTVSLDRAYRSSIDTAFYAALQIAALTLVLAVALARVSMTMLAPLADLVRVIRTGEVDARLPRIAERSPSEVHVIYGAIEAMRQRIAEDNRRLQEYANGLEAMVSVRTRDLERARDEAERANRAKTLFLANVSHELRTPLQAIILHARLIGGAADPAVARGSIETILRSSSHLLELIEQLLDLSKAEAGHELEVSYSSFSVGELIEEVAAAIRPTLSVGNTLTVSCAEPLEVVSDRTGLMQVLYNLVRNADKFTKDGHIDLRLVRLTDPDCAVLSVSDNGIGIPTEHLSRIFDPFYQGETVRGTVSSGIGIGLWLTKRIVDALHGRIEVSSTPGVGTRFRVEIPIAPTDDADARPGTAPATDRGTVASAAHAHHAIRVLFAEDEEVVRGAMSIFLREAGFSVSECVDGQSALAMLESGPDRFDAIVLDHRMPVHTGLEILRTLRAVLKSQTPVILLTGNETSELLAEASQYGATLVAKPIQPERLILAVAQSVDRAAAISTHPKRAQP